MESWKSERGAILVMVAVAIVALIAFSALAIDYGVMWSARRQAQNAADAGAHAGAVSMAFDAPGDFDRARASAETTGKLTKIFGLAPNINRGSGDTTDITQDISFPDCPVGAPGLPDTCVRVNVYRKSGRDPLPTFLARLFGRLSQGVQATATAQVLTGNATDCMKPWAIPDKWGEKVKCSNDEYKNDGTCKNPGTYVANTIWDETSGFDKYMKVGNDTVLNPAIGDPVPGYDYYQAPTATDPGTGYQPFDANGAPTADYGRQIFLKLGAGEGFISPGWFLALDLPGCEAGGGGDCYRWNIKNCNPTVWAIGEELTVSSENGVKQGPTEQGVTGQGGPDQEVPGILERDPDAEWSNCATTGAGGTCIPGIINSCAPGYCPAGLNGTDVYMTKSPRIVPVPLFDVDGFYEGAPNGKTSVEITNIAGFFIEGMGGTGNKAVVGRLMSYPGLSKGTSSVDETASFLRQVILVR